MLSPEIRAYDNQVREAGYCVIPNVIPAAACEPLRQHLHSIGTKLRRKEGYTSLQVSAVMGLLSVDQSVAQYLADQRVLAILESLLGKNIRISFTSLLINELRKRRTNMHADWPFN